MCNSIAARALLSTDLVENTGIPTHVPVIGYFGFQEYGQEVLRVMLPRPFPVENRTKLDPKQANELARGCMGSHLESWLTAIAREDVDHVWRVWCHISEQYLAERSWGQSSPLRGYKGRGCNRKPQRCHSAARQVTGQVGVQTAPQRQYHKLSRQLEELIRQCRRCQLADRLGSTPYSVEHLWKLIRDKLAGLRPLDSRLAGLQDEMPTIGELDVVLGIIRDLSHKEGQLCRDSRIKAWQTWVKESWSSKRKAVFAACTRQIKSGGVNFVASDGRLTANLEEMDKMVRDAWLPIFQKFANREEPSWQQFRDKYDRHIKACPMEVTEITGEELQRIVTHMSGSPGMDGWRISELKALPLSILNGLADMFNLIERTGRWPTSLERAVVSLIPKGQGYQPLDLRPISVMSCVYRLWAARRLQDVKKWQEKWASHGQHAFRAQHSVEDIFWVLALR
eukprot:10589747-Karenia_brevis.AAC.1